MVFERSRLRRNRTTIVPQDTDKLQVIRAANAPGIVFSEFVKANRERFERTLDWKLGRVLGCGFFGCVMTSEGPWVAKVTRDETEGPVWAYIQELFGDSELTYEMSGFCRVSDVVRLKPDILWEEQVGFDQWQKSQQPLFAIRREEALPVFRVAGDDLAPTPHTLSLLGLDPELRATWNQLVDSAASESIPFEALIGVMQLSIVEQEITIYRAKAASYVYATTMAHEWEGEPPSVIAEQLRESCIGMMTNPDGEANPFGYYLGQTLLSAFDNADMALRDLHEYNLGWRVHEEIDGDERPLCMVVLDPGLAKTPYDPQVEERELLANKQRRLLQKNGWLR